MSIRTLVIGLVFALFSALILIGIWSALVDPAFATAESDDEQVLSGTHQGVQRLASSQVRVYDAQLEDAFAAGGEVTLDRVTANDLFVAGGSLRVREVVAEDLVIAGGEIRLQAQLHDDLLVAGGRVQLDPGSIVGGDVVAAGGDLEIAGRIDGNVTVAGGRVVLAGVIAGAVDVWAGELVIDPRARVAGPLVYRSSESARISPLAVLSGGVRHVATRTAQVSGWAVAGFGIGGLLFAFLGMALMAAVLHAAVPHPINAALVRFHARPWLSWMIGFALLVAVPVAANVLLITIVGIPLGLLFYAVYTAGLAFGVVTTAHEIGRFITRGERVTSDTPMTKSRVGRTALGMSLLVLLALIPFLGWLALLAVIPAGVGAFAAEFWRDLRPAHKP